jgi:hypothetical protein
VRRGEQLLLSVPCKLQGSQLLHVTPPHPPLIHSVSGVRAHTNDGVDVCVLCVCVVCV